MSILLLEMTELDEIKKDIADTKAELKKAKENGASEAMLISLQNTLTEQQKEKNLLLAGSGDWYCVTSICHRAVAVNIPEFNFYCIRY